MTYFKNSIIGVVKMYFLTDLYVPTLSHLYESLNAFQSLVFFIISDAEHAQLRLTFVSPLGVHNKTCHERNMDRFSEIQKKKPITKIH